MRRSEEDKTMATPTLDFKFGDGKANMDKRTFSGLAATWDMDQRKDVIIRGAFAQTINERGPRNDGGSKIKILWMHNPYHLLGRPAKMEETADGLFVESNPLAKTAMAEEVLELIRNGDLDVMSIGYNVMRHEYDEGTDVRYLKEIKLFEYSPVSFAMNEATAITGLKSPLIDQDFFAWFKQLDARELKRLQEILQFGENFDQVKKAIAEIGSSPLPASNGTKGTGTASTDGKSHEDPDPAIVAGIQSLASDMKQMFERWNNDGRAQEGP
jgi:uncharacterized protein